MVKRVAPHWLLLSAALALGGAARARAQTAVLTTTAPPAADDEDTPVCKSELRLSGAVYDAARPERSMALVQL
ncbi:MAG TPA: hypothetical protein VJR89_00820, partial [Polyangiales bacterium]|nr:hypothetical protein [Polyangiales bacterium]